MCVCLQEFPILSENSRTAASYALALDEQLKFLTYHSKLMSSRGSVNPALLERTLKEIGVDVEAVKSARRRCHFGDHDRTQALAGALGINGTPAFVINDEIHPGALSEDRLRELVAEARDKVQDHKLNQSGKRRTGVGIEPLAMRPAKYACRPAITA